jgi:uncharacterized protein DUF2877
LLSGDDQRGRSRAPPRFYLTVVRHDIIRALKITVVIGPRESFLLNQDPKPKEPLKREVGAAKKGAIGGRIAAEAYSIGGQAFDRIAHSDRLGLIHSTFTGAINVRTSGGLVSVVPRETGRGPLNINVDFRAFGATLPKPGGRVKLGADGLSFEGGQVISFRNANHYDPDGMFASTVLSPGQIARNVKESKTVALFAGHMDGLGPLLEVLGSEDSKGSRAINPFAAAASSTIRILIAAIQERDNARVAEAASKLAGLGIGLTPSADDLLSGMMVCLALGARNGIRGVEPDEVAATIIDAAKGRTSELSFEFLREAAFGRTNEKIAKLVESIYTEGASEVRRSTVGVISMGETSGTDSIVGVLIGVDLALKGRTAAPDRTTEAL